MEQKKLYNQTVYTPFWPVYGGGKLISINRGLIYNSSAPDNYVVPTINEEELLDFEAKGATNTFEVKDNKGVIYAKVKIDNTPELGYYKILSATIESSSKLPKSSMLEPNILICNFEITGNKIKFSKIRRSDIPIWVRWVASPVDQDVEDDNIPDDDILKDIELLTHNFEVKGLSDIELKYKCKPNGPSSLQGHLEIICKTSKYNFDMTAWGAETNYDPEPEEGQHIYQTGSTITSFSSSEEETFTSRVEFT